MSDYLWLVPFCPFLGAALILLLGNRVLRKHSHWPCIVGAAAACVLSIVTLVTVQGLDDEKVLLQNRYVWFQTGDVDVVFSMRADALTCVMLLTVTFIGSLIAIYSVGYMSHDVAYP